MRPCPTCGSVMPAGQEACRQCSGTVLIESETLAISTAAAVVAPIASTPRSFSTTNLPDEDRFVPGTLIAGRYRIVGLLGKGGMGEVYRATDLTLAQPVALKFLPEDAVTNPLILERFHNEVRVARQVSHPNVCRVYDIGEADNVPFISMEYIDGEDLGSLLARIGRLPADKALEIARKLCAGVASAHSRGIIHRDLKPQNIMLNRRGEVVIMDFGLAALSSELRGMEARNGTPAYMSPEQLRGEVVTPKSDIYALGLIIFELFTGRRAFEGNTVAALLKAQESDRLISLTTLATDADPQVEKAIACCLKANPQERPETALAVAALLPGGDPLAAALAAGETPSPELVAASGKVDAVPLKYTLALAIVCGLAIIGILFGLQRISLLARAPLEYPPVVLEQKARDLLASLGHTPPRADSWSTLEVNGELISTLARRSDSQNISGFLKAESAWRLIYRQSPALLLAPPEGSISADRPANNVPGMVLMRVDGSGRLRHLEAFIGAEDKVTQNPPSLDAVFRAAGFDLSRFEQTTSVVNPKVPFDAQSAWKGSHPGIPDLPVRVAVATWKGVPVSFRIIWPWMNADKPVPPPSTQAVIFDAIRIAVLAIGLIAVLVFARWNLSAGRGDRAGAMKLAMFSFTVGVLIRLLPAHFVPDFAFAGYMYRHVAIVVSDAVLIWLIYIALEPFVRRTWPETLITWNRILVGRWTDPRVGWHILVGLTAGIGLRVFFIVRQYGNSISVWPHPNMLQSTSQFVALWIDILRNAVETSFIIFFLLCGLKALLRRDWLAALVAALLVSLLEYDIRTSSNLPLDLTLYVAVLSVPSFLLLRMGLVAAIACIFAVNASHKLQIAPDFRAWFNAPAIVALLILAALLVYASWASQRSNPLKSIT